MCIRDSFRLAQAFEVLRQQRRADAAEAVFAVAGLAMLLVPVSYTHLRAHETVLDLVCRLLLEKKKNPLFHDVLLIHRTN